MPFENIKTFLATLNVRAVHIMIFIEGYASAMIRDQISRTMFISFISIGASLAILAFVVLPLRSFYTNKTDCEAGKGRHIQDGALRSSDSADIHNIGSVDLRFRWSLSKIIYDDSIGAILDLPDSLMLLVCHGVVLRTCPILQYRLSPLRGSFPFNRRLRRMCESILTVDAGISTIPKIPITVKKAPRDTAADAKERNTCSMPRNGIVAAELWFDLPLKIRIHERSLFSITNILFVSPVHRLYSGWIAFSRDIVALFRGKSVPVSIDISIELSHDDATVFYRAFPMHGKLAIRI